MADQIVFKAPEHFGDIYKHWKGGKYMMVGIGHYEPNPYKVFVVYLDEYGNLWVRDEHVFFGDNGHGEIRFKKDDDQVQCVFASTFGRAYRRIGENGTVWNVQERSDPNAGESGG